MSSCSKLLISPELIILFDASARNSLHANEIPGKVWTAAKTGANSATDVYCKQACLAWANLIRSNLRCNEFAVVITTRPLRAEGRALLGLQKLDGCDRARDLWPGHNFGPGRRDLALGAVYT